MGQILNFWNRNEKSNELSTAIVSIKKEVEVKIESLSFPQLAIDNRDSLKRYIDFSLFSIRYKETYVDAITDKDRIAKTEYCDQLNKFYFALCNNLYEFDCQLRVNLKFEKNNLHWIIYHSFFINSESAQTLIERYIRVGQKNPTKFFLRLKAEIELLSICGNWPRLSNSYGSRIHFDKCGQYQEALKEIEMLMTSKTFYPSVPAEINWNRFGNHLKDLFRLQIFSNSSKSNLNDAIDDLIVSLKSNNEAKKGKNEVLKRFFRNKRNRQVFLLYLNFLAVNENVIIPKGKYNKFVKEWEKEFSECSMKKETLTDFLGNKSSRIHRINLNRFGDNFLEMNTSIDNLLQEKKGLSQVSNETTSAYTEPTVIEFNSTKEFLKFLKSILVY